MTEEEAKTKWCPQTFATPEIPAVREAGPWTCSGSGCAAWRWQPHRATVTSTVSKRPEPFLTGHPQDYENNPDWSVERLPLQGYCGLAGAPQ